MSILTDVSISAPAFFWFPFARNVFFHPLNFNPYVFLGLKWVSCRQHIYWSWFCIHSASLCLLVEAFNLFTFKVIIDIYVPFVIFLIVSGWFCRSFSFSCISYSFFFFILLTNIWSHSIAFREDAWYDFNFLKFTEVWFVTQDVVYPGECSTCTWEGVFFCIWMECREDINEIHFIYCFI